jgi:ABC-type uncharacterized transport system substrate-binding protein
LEFQRGVGTAAHRAAYLYQFVVNLKTAKAVGIKIAESILLRADE